MPSEVDAGEPERHCCLRQIGRGCGRVRLCVDPLGLLRSRERFVVRPVREAHLSGPELEARLGYRLWHRHVADGRSLEVLVGGDLSDGWSLVVASEGQSSFWDVLETEPSDGVGLIVVVDLAPPGCGIDASPVVGRLTSLLVEEASKDFGDLRSVRLEDDWDEPSHLMFEVAGVTEACLLRRSSFEGSALFGELPPGLCPRVFLHI